MSTATQSTCDATKKNVGEIERIVSVISGTAFILKGVSHPSIVGLIKTGIGAGLIYRGFTGSCSVYKALGVNTAEEQSERSPQNGKGIKVEKTIQINKPRAELFEFWENVENLPKVMSHLKSVEKIDNDLSKWTAETGMGQTVTWNAKIINEIENELIAWKSVKGADVPNVGSVRFEDAGEGATTIKLSIQFYPPGGDIGTAIVKLLGENPADQIGEDLQKFKTEMESKSESAFASAHV